MRLIAVLEHFAHHNAQTSPDNMINYIHYDQIVRPAAANYQGGLMRMANGAIQVTAGMVGYKLNSLQAEYAVWKATRHSSNLIHFFNGDTNSKWMPYLKGNNRIITTYHQPPDYFYQFFKKCDHIRRLDTALITSNALRELLSKYLPDDRIVFQPLAVDTEFFRPPEARADNERKVCLMVGNWLRDFETARKVMDDLSGRNDIEFHVISMEANRHHFAGCKNVIFRSGVPIADYMDELHGADLMMLPLKSGTSNLAVLEAMAVGLPVVTTDLPGTRDYVDPSFCALVKRGDSSGFGEAVIALLADDQGRKDMSNRARQRALKFSWPAVAERLMANYRDYGATPKTTGQ